jgi:hypothetical protein
MVTVLNPKPHASVLKTCVCRNCGAELQYTPSEVQRGVDSDYAGGRDPYTYIVCPQCTKEVRT